ncbi:ATP-binding cassette domain-containing protein [Chryseolinea lacunae]|uniref:ATP-binding cassette domain-containing protein n=1 Tax=Chryseolinea lacunae TaxID=2801331 RepID=A0ABS1KRD3_9BACT|nr:ATP-binding cassette domain-containing protein [Chryseolinea lacunae]MBL0741999.1 ATP-binding cassette domain-containing protein [Chryseolinea lacunae]
MAPLVLEGISHTYAQQPALHNVTVAFPGNKVTAVLGKSGSGKSTLLQVLNGMIRPAQGKVFFLNLPFDYAAADALRLRMGYVIQGVGLFPHLTVERNILLGTRLQNLSAQQPEARMDSLMTKMNLPLAYKQKYPFELSGGEQQRVGICRALLHNPPVLLMDEPLGALDAITREDIQHEILQLQKTEQRTIIIITHSPQEAAALADYILVLDEGRVLQFDTKENVLQRPVNTLVQRLTSTQAS